ncbi:LytTR family DNA-binding domain-containing protein [Thalassovita sp.]|uniref:LytTR family DNA-binding domain-containing protein n=1 Tax=Thalassovita sp. TaxID=1979401 RepID=UPI0029DE53EB|nr:LytTR family DNA-binding domain-containing protein [Thalassovita sp.]
MGEIPEKLLHLLQRPVTYAVWGLLSALLAVMGPFGTLTALEWPQRTVYWFVTVGLAALVSVVVSALSGAVAPNRHSWRNDLSRIAGMTILFSPLGWLWTHFYPVMGDMPKPTLWVFAVFVALVSVVIRVGHRVIRGDETRFVQQEEGGLRPEVEAPEAPEPQAEPPRLMRRLPNTATGPVLRLSASDHMVEVVLREETHSLRMRFTDAIDEMDGVEGYCSHRSHWVVRAAIAEVEREGARTYLRLENGDCIPVSRTYRPRLEAAGIL